MGVVQASVLLISTFAVVSGIISAKGFYCKDPDTGKLYPVNSTWSSSSFCGSYTCKLRRKNHTDNQSEANDNTQKINTSQTLVNEQLRATEEQKNCTDPINIAIENGNKHLERLIHKDKGDDHTYIKLENFKNIELGASTGDGDRYLTPDEIKALTLILKTMKKSDLEAILEIYNLAQDIYKEIDKATDESILRDFNLDIKQKKENGLPINHVIQNNKNFVSYWYEPLTSSNHKHKVNDISKIPARLREDKDSISNIFVEGPNLLAGPPRPTSNSQAYFSSSFSNNDFSKLPYYYSVPNFQRQSSHVHHQMPYAVAYGPSVPIVNPNPPIPLPETLPPKQKCSKYSEGSIKKTLPWFKFIHKPYIFEVDKINDDKFQKKPAVFMQSDLNPQTLQLPLAYLQYNFSNGLPNTNIVVNRVVDNPWAFFNSHSKPLHNHPFLEGPYLAQVPSNIHENVEGMEDIQSEIENDTQNEEQKVGDKSIEEEKSILPEWQTEQLSSNVLNEVRANIDENRLLPFPFRKKIKLERVGKIMKVDELNRIKRDTANLDVAQNEDFEPYLVKSTCQSDTEPGFFRMGNSTQPYPACCPQRIS